MQTVLDILIAAGTIGAAVAAAYGAWQAAAIAKRDRRHAAELAHQEWELAHAAELAECVRGVGQGVGSDNRAGNRLVIVYHLLGGEARYGRGSLAALIAADPNHLTYDEASLLHGAGESPGVV
jgi:hypothetical protein